VGATSGRIRLESIEASAQTQFGATPRRRRHQRRAGRDRGDRDGEAPHRGQAVAQTVPLTNCNSAGARMEARCGYSCRSALIGLMRDA
jgi:hypothetical protein